MCDIVQTVVFLHFTTDVNKYLLHLFFKSEDDVRNYYEENKKNWKGAQFYNQKSDDFEKAKKIKII